MQGATAAAPFEAQGEQKGLTCSQKLLLKVVVTHAATVDPNPVSGPQSHFAVAALEGTPPVKELLPSLSSLSPDTSRPLTSPDSPRLEDKSNTARPGGRAGRVPGGKVARGEEAPARNMQMSSTRKWGLIIWCCCSALALGDNRLHC